jgi:hypothetical protein
MALPPLQQLALEAAIGELAGIVGPWDGVEQCSEHVARAGSLGRGIEDLGGGEANQAERVKRLERLLVLGQQALADKLHQDDVRALEGGEDVAVGAERAEPVLREVA